MFSLKSVGKILLEAGFVTFLMFSSSVAVAAAGCIGSVAKLWVEADDNLYFNIKPSNTCACNHIQGDVRGFKVPTGQPNKGEQYTALLAAFMADKEVMAWYDWDGADGTNRCKSYNISLSK
ncbi:hypothetical protein [Microbulbifer agarilyticus]